MSKILIGIDPDVDKSGVAYIGINKEMQLNNMTFFELFDYLAYAKKVSENILITSSIPLKVYIEAGWLNKTNWHANKLVKDEIKNIFSSKGFNVQALYKLIAIVAQIGARTGANHETGRKIAEMCEHLHIDYELVRPTQSKVKADYFKQMTKYQKRTNQEQRDAAMLIWGR